LLCVGLDPGFAKLPASARDQFEFNKAIIDATHDLVSVYKPNPAFYEARGADGVAALKRTCDYIKSEYPEIPILIDARRGDIGNNCNNGKFLQPGYNNHDLSLFKKFPLKNEKRSLEFRWETFNTFNHTQWAGVNAGISVPNPSSPVTTSSQGSTGQVSSTRDPRNIQFGLKLIF